MSNQQTKPKAPFTQTEAVTAAPEVPVPVVVADNPIAEADDVVPTEVVVVPEWFPPTYDFAGSNLGGQSVYNCGVCWGVVLRDSQAAHSEWHHRLETGRV